MPMQCIFVGIICGKKVSIQTFSCYSIETIVAKESGKINALIFWKTGRCMVTHLAN